jgi:hypothetical protein
MFPKAFNSINLFGKKLGNHKTAQVINEYIKRNDIKSAIEIANKHSFVKFLPKSLVTRETIYPDDLSKEQFNILKSKHDPKAHANNHGVILKNCGNFSFNTTHKLGINTSPIPLDKTGHYCNGLCISCGIPRSIQRITPLIGIVDLPIDHNFDMTLTKHSLVVNKIDIKSITSPTSKQDLLRLNISPKEYLSIHRENCSRELLIELALNGKYTGLATCGLALNILHNIKDPLFDSIFDYIVTPMGGMYLVAEEFLKYTDKKNEVFQNLCASKIV